MTNANLEAVKQILFSKTYTNEAREYVSVPNSKVQNSAYMKDLKYFLEFFGQEFDSEASYLSIKLNADKFPLNVYGPTVFKSEDGEPVLRLDKEQFLPLQTIFEATKGDSEDVVVVSIDESNLVIDLPPSTAYPDGLSMEFGVRYINPSFEERTLEKSKYLRAINSKNAKNLATFIAELPKAAKYKKVSELDENSTYPVLSWTRRDTDFGVVFDLRLEGVDFIVQSNTSVRNAFNMNPINTPDNPPLLRTGSLTTTKQGKKMMDTVVLNLVFPEETGIDLDW